MSKPKVNIGSLLNPGSSTFAQSRGLYNFKLGETTKSLLAFTNKSLNEYNDLTTLKE